MTRATKEIGTPTAVYPGFLISICAFLNIFLFVAGLSEGFTL